ncbi:putative membrane protein YeaQ/YmgE (transglycosylase-associated protein family) [Halopolyspora algeriensis]|uniref:Putative membrane protein YeaQ/YmgE (Transglycosylase-associated protein family) n=1 Tax=Halopolyspora algeriensis TaxID=1500506 RepID=A0A368VGQ2_9ACTN|nr:GlsB/YeaQ/YmgE family stress response membrane protein [Halopolyspora algeriensis]RCW39823.1 putative membrane protein YeaQ/YmgE (transglycosylase-associated protein family) [Halopolyspora algeriensis]TQM56478.1 putative membrane protein YeaQ/YmgE (transglycosylase-associated protein family) [Halopolyspora algeriensis]
MSIIGWLVLGLIAGALAKLIMPGRDPGGVLVTLLLGVAGAFLGGFLGSWIFEVGITQFWSLSTWLLAIAGSIIVLGLYRMVAGDRAGGKPADR